ncbi:interferon-inducible GTPase 5-like [Symsagittifera roscoffensis]|uniref:interferon-inducible GTPase 5-like n=1 Tax=Symsagittifera roscoffensis TaxID=84072 RepID=UPI00307B10D5
MAQAGDIEGETSETIAELTKTYGMGSTLYEKMKEAREKWRKEVINIAVIGQARQGKSSLINAFMGEKVAEVSALGVTTTDVRPFPHPSNSNIILWDVPGVDAVNHQRDVYIDSIGYKEHPYDFFLIVTKDIFSSDAKFVAELVQKENKKFYLVRTHIDHSIRDEKEDNEDMSEEEVVAKIRKNLQTEIERLGFDTEHKVYIVNCRRPKQLDFPRLQRDICEDNVSTWKREAFLLTIRAFGQQMIDMKFDMFKTRIYKVALASAAGGAIPIPGVGAMIDMVILIEELLTYFVGFGLTRGAIASLEELNGLESGTIESDIAVSMEKDHKLLFLIRKEAPDRILSKEALKTAALTIVKTCSGIILTELTLIAASEAVESSVAWFLPILGSVIAAGISYSVTAYQLRLILKEVKEVAELINACIK